MNLTEILQATLLVPQTAWNCAATTSNLFSSELICSMAVNLTLLAIALLGAIRLVAGRHTAPGNAAERG
jgi:cell division protein FtsL